MLIPNISVIVTGCDVSVTIRHWQL